MVTPGHRGLGLARCSVLLVGAFLATLAPAQAEGPEAPGEQRPVRVLVDLSRCQNGGGALTYESFQSSGAEVTLNYGLLSASLLDNYDVVFMTGHGPRSGPSGPGPDLPYTEEEVTTLWQYVRAGGGLLVAASGAAWRAVHQLPMTEMARNQVLDRAGIAFTGDPVRMRPRAEGHPALLERDPRVLRHLFGEDAYLAGALKVTAKGFTPVITAPGKAILAVAGPWGKGRLIVVATDYWAMDPALGRDGANGELVRGFVRWLADRRVSRRRGSESIPQMIDPPVVMQTPGLTLMAIPQLSKRARQAASWCTTIDEELRSCLGVACQGAIGIRLLAGDQGGWTGGSEAIAVCGVGDDRFLVATLAHEIGHVFWEPAIPPAWFGEPMANRLAARATRRILPDADLTWLTSLGVEEWRKEDPGGKRLDLAPYGTSVTPVVHAKGDWVIGHLVDQYGADFIARYARLVRKDARAHKIMTSDELVYFLGQAAGTSLAPWFRSIGTTIKSNDPFAAAR